MVTWNDLFIRGALIDVDVHIWRARMQLKARDLGIEDSEDVRKALSLGCHRLAPPEAFDAINDYARSASKAVELPSLPFSLIQGVRYVPDEQFNELKAKLEVCQRGFNAAVDEFIARYEEMKAEMMPVIKSALDVAAQSSDAAIRGYERVCAEYPTPAEVRSKFSIVWRVFTIASPSSQAAAQAIGDGKEEVSDVLANMIRSLRDELSERVGVLVELAKRGERLPTKSVNSAMALLDRVERMNVMDDYTLREQCRVLQIILQECSDDNTDGKESIGRVLDDLSSIKNRLSDDIESAVKAAEEKLVGLGKRKISL